MMRKKFCDGGEKGSDFRLGLVPLLGFDRSYPPGPLPNMEINPLSEDLVSWDSAQRYWNSDQSLETVYTFWKFTGR